MEPRLLVQQELLPPQLIQKFQATPLAYSTLQREAPCTSKRSGKVPQKHIQECFLCLCHGGWGNRGRNSGVYSATYTKLRLESETLIPNLVLISFEKPDVILASFWSLMQNFGDFRISTVWSFFNALGTEWTPPRRLRCRSIGFIENAFNEKKILSDRSLTDGLRKWSWPRTYAWQEVWIAFSQYDPIRRLGPKFVGKCDFFHFREYHQAIRDTGFGRYRLSAERQLQDDFW